jgi:hypothetical protein
LVQEAKAHKGLYSQLVGDYIHLVEMYSVLRTIRGLPPPLEQVQMKMCGDALLPGTRQEKTT